MNICRVLLRGNDYWERSPDTHTHIPIWWLGRDTVNGYICTNFINSSRFQLKSAEGIRVKGLRLMWICDTLVDLWSEWLSRHHRLMHYKCVPALSVCKHDTQRKRKLEKRSQ